MGPNKVGPYRVNQVALGDCRELGQALPDESIDVLVTSPPYWGQRMSAGTGAEADPREYVSRLAEIFRVLQPKMKRDGIAWVNIGDAYNTPVNWRPDDRDYSSLGPSRTGLDENNSAYVKPRARRKAYLLRAEAPWLAYGNLLALPYRLVLGDVRRRLALPGRGHLAEEEPDAGGTVPAAAPGARVGLPVRAVGKARVPDRPAGQERLGVLERADDRAGALLAVPAGAAAALRLGPRAAGGRRGGARPLLRQRHLRAGRLSLGCSYVGFEIDPEQVTPRMRASRPPRGARPR